VTSNIQDIERVLVDAEEIERRVQEVANKINQDYKDVDELILIGILKGAFIFLADLSRHVTVPHIVDFMALSSYGKTAESTGEVRIIMDLREPIEYKHIVIVEDIVDTGNTLRYLLRILRGRNPTSIRTCVLSKKVDKGEDIPIDYLGFEIPDVWVVGYGLDLADHYRTLPYIAELKKEVYQSG
jgi:hypoxanthine phosphoribosyltransferase